MNPLRHPRLTAAIVLAVVVVAALLVFAVAVQLAMIAVGVAVVLGIVIAVLVGWIRLRAAVRRG